MKNLIIISFVLSAAFGQAQTHPMDLGFWGWIKVNKQISKRQTIGVQYQVRLKDNWRQFDRNNFYVNYAYDFKHKLTGELLYQWNTNYTMDQHTFYVGLSKKVDFGKSSFIVRSAFQYIRNMHNIQALGYAPYLEWRNRIRFKYALSKRFSGSVSGEPYLHFDHFSSPIRVSRTRYIAQIDYLYNKNTTLSVYFLMQPSPSNHAPSSIKNVIGFTYQLDLPKKHTAIEKLFAIDKN